MSFTQSGKSFPIDHQPNYSSEYSSENPSDYSQYSNNLPNNTSSNLSYNYQSNSPNNFQQTNQANCSSNIHRGEQFLKNFNQSENINFAGLPSLSLEDLRIVKEVYREAFFKRSVPLSIVSCSAIFLLSKRGLINASALKYFGAITASYFFGNWSYRTVMREKIVNSDSQSPFAVSLRRNFGNQNMTKSFTSNKPWNSSNQFSLSSSTTEWSGTSEFAPDENCFDIPNDSSEPKLEVENENKNKFTTYDELRMKNRANYKF